MAGRWRTAQRRKRWTDNAACLPPEALERLDPWPSLRPLAHLLQSLGTQPSTYAQLAQIKHVGTTLLATLDLLQKEEEEEELLKKKYRRRSTEATLDLVQTEEADEEGEEEAEETQDLVQKEELRKKYKRRGTSAEEEARIAVRVVVEILFVENSRPLHRFLLSILARAPIHHLRKAFRECCREYGVGGRRERRFSVVGVSASLASLPQPGVMKEIAGYCATSMANSLCCDVRSVLQHALEGGRPTPTAMEECQDALSSIYYLIQQLPDRFHAHRGSHCVRGEKDPRWESGGKVHSSEGDGFVKDSAQTCSENFESGGGESTGNEGSCRKMESLEGNCTLKDSAQTCSENFELGDGQGTGDEGSCRKGVSLEGNLTIKDSAQACSEIFESRAGEGTGKGGVWCSGCEGGERCGASGEDICGAIVCCLLDVLQTAVLSRDCLVAAGVGMAAAAQLRASKEGLALVLASTLFPAAHSTYALLSPEEGLSDAVGDRGILETMLILYRNSNLRAEMDQLSDFGKLCLFRGLLTAVPRSAQNVHLLRNSFQSGVASGENKCGSEEPQWQAWTLLYDGILPALCRFCESSVDSHFKFHAVTALQICLQQIKTSICGHITSSAAKDFQQLTIRHNVLLQRYDPLPAAMVSQVLQLIWNNWEDPLTQTVKQVQAVFDLLVDVQLVHKREMYDSHSIEMHNFDKRANFTQSDSMKMETYEVGTDSFLQQIANDLLAAGRYRKGKYVPLASLVLRIGARKMLLMSPDLLFQTVDAFSDDDVCSSASTFLKIFLERLKEECWSAEGLMEGTVVARRFWIPALLSGLLTGDPRLRNNLTTYALPVAMHIDNDSLLIVLAYILDGHRNPDVFVGNSLSWEELEGAHGLPGHLSLEQQVTLLISFLKVARSLALVEGSIEHKLKPDELTVKYEGKFEDNSISNILSMRKSHAVICTKGQPIEVPVSLLLLALTHKEDGLRVDAAELMCLNPKTASMPSPLELCFLRTALPLNMRCSSTAFRMRWTSFLKKFFLRVRTAVERQQKAEKLGKSHSNELGLPSNLDGVTAIQKGAISSSSSITFGKRGGDNNDSSRSAVSLQEMQEFMQWMSQMLVSSLYPSAPYERKNMAMEMFNALIDAWSLKRSWEKRSGRYTSSPYLDTVGFSPYHESLLSVDFTLVVVGAVVDSWDRLREGAFRILIQYPTPLPGLDSDSSIQGLLTWAKGMVNSPRVRESDAGALAFRLIFRKYVLDLGWFVKVHPEPRVVVTSTSQDDGNFEQGLGEAIVQYLESLNDWLQWGIDEGDRDLLKACSHSFVHGVLLVLRYTVEEIDWNSPCVQTCSESLRAALARLLNLLLRVTSLALWVVSADALNLQEKLGGPLLPGSTSSENEAPELAVMNADTEPVDEEYESDGEVSLAPAEQMVMVGCWLSVKEVSLLLGTVARRVPLRESPSGDSNVERTRENGTQQRHASSDTKESSAMLDGEQLEAIGSHFVQVLLSMKHNGAIDKTRTGFIALCDRLLRSSDPWLNKLPEIWLQQLMEHTGAKGQVVDDLLRRSAGIPPAFLALFLAEPDGSPKKLLPTGMRWLIDKCRKFLKDSRCPSQGAVSKSEASKCREGENFLIQTELVVPANGMAGDDLVQLEEYGVPFTLKSRDEGVVPTVHAFNILRMAFHDTNLATDTSGFCAEGLITAIQGFASSYWEVRNSATLAFTALVHRTIGFLNVYKRESARRAITGFEFFHRYPTLHPFLLKELQSATWQLEHGTCSESIEQSGLASSLHPSLGPVLIILSRLKPSFINSDVEDWLNPSAFMPYVTQCATQRNLHVRVLASRALAPLVSSEDLFGVLLLLTQTLPLSASRKGPQVVTTDENLVVSRSSILPYGSSVSGFPKASSFNAIHGVLLQMYTLLISNCTSLPDLDQRLKIVTEVSQLVEERLWLGSISVCGCYMVIGAFLDMLGALLSLGKVCQKKSSSPQILISRLYCLVRELSSECLDDSSQDSRFHDSTKVGLREKAAKLYFQTMLMRGPFNSLYHNSGCNLDFKNSDAQMELQTFENRNGTLGLCVQDTRFSCLTVPDNVEHFARRLRQALVDNSYEVRLATLNVLKKYCNFARAESEQSVERPCQSDIQAREFKFLRPLIILRLTIEKHPLCIHRILQVIYAWTLMDENDKKKNLFTHWKYHPTSTLGRESVWGSILSAQELWYSLLQIYNNSKQIKTKEVAMQCLGGCLHLVRFDILNLIGCTDVGKGSASSSEEHLVSNGGAQFEVLLNGKISSNPTQDECRNREVVNMWLDIVKRHFAASEPVNFRRATAEAIVASGILEDAKRIGVKLSQQVKEVEFIDKISTSDEPVDLEWYGKVVLSAWCICIKLLEDEDLDLRQKLSLSVLNVVACSNLQTTDVVPAQVEKVVQVSFEFLGVQFGCWRYYYDVLAEWVLGSDDDVDLISGNVDLVHRLFDKEIDNHHEEELLFVQLCCLHLNRFMQAAMNQALHGDGGQSALSMTSTGIVHTAFTSLGGGEWTKETTPASWYMEFVWKWRRKFLERAKLCAQLSVQIKESMQWVGGVTNHQDTFKMLYRNLLGLLIFAGPMRDRKGLITHAHSGEENNFVSGLGEVSRLLRKLPLNPLVSNALVQILQAYEQQLQVNLDSVEIVAELGAAFFAKFDPLFLLS